MPADGQMAEFRDMAVEMGQNGVAIALFTARLFQLHYASHCTDVPGEEQRQPSRVAARHADLARRSNRGLRSTTG
jgi:hypothetical protein